MPWRRKADGRPYADTMVNATRYRESLLTTARRDQGPPWPDDAQCDTLYQLWKTHRLPQLLAGAPHGATSRDNPTPAAPEPGNPTIASLGAWYVDVIMVSRANAQETRDSNRRLFATLTTWMQAQHIQQVDDLAKHQDTIDLWTTHRLKTHAPGTVRKELCVIRAAFRAALDRDIIHTPPIRTWPRIRRTEPIYAEPLTPDQIHAILEFLKGKDTACYASIIFLAYTGCRPSDASRLRKDRLFGLDTSEPTALIRQQKTGKLVSVALTPPAIAAIRLGLTPDNKTPYVWPSRYGRPRKSVVLYNAVRRAGASMGLHVTPKSFRQALVSTLFDAGADQAMIAAITGHRSDAIEAYRKLRRSAAHALANQYADHLAQTTENVTTPSPQIVTPPPKPLV